MVKMIDYSHPPPNGPVCVSCDRCGEFKRYALFRDANAAMGQRLAPIFVMVNGERLPHVGRVKECGCVEREKEMKRELARKRKVTCKARGDETPGMFEED